MFYCFIYEDIEESTKTPLVIQMEYARRIGKLYICNIKKQKVYNGCNQNSPVNLIGKRVLLRSTYDNMLQGIQLVKKYGADLIEDEADIDKIENWYKLGLTNRLMFHVDLSAIENGMLDIGLQKYLGQWENIFFKSIEKGFSAVIKASRILHKDPQVLAFLSEQFRKYGGQFIVSEYMKIRTDSIGKRESRHIVMNSQVLNSSRLVHSIRHTVPKSHLNKIEEIVLQIKDMKNFPQNYVLDLGEFEDKNGKIFIDIIELNPLTCSMCYVNNSVFTTEVSEIKEVKEKLLIGYEYCYNCLKNPQDYHEIRSSVQKYYYTNNDIYYFL